MPAIQFVGDAYSLRSANVATSRMVNLYTELVQTPQGPRPAFLQGTPGTLLWQTLPGTGPVRALYTSSQGRVFAVQGAGLYELLATATSTLRGTILTTAGPVSLADNGVHLVLVDGSPTGYTLTLLDNTFGPITDPDFQGATHVAFLDQYLLFNRPGTQQFYWSDLTSVSFDGLDLASAEGTPDDLLALTVHNRELWLFGRYSTEVWFDVGPPAIFTRIQGAFLECGLEAPYSIAADQGGIYWLGQTRQGGGIVYRARGYQPEPVSTHAISQALQGYTTRDDALGWCQQQDGHYFYWLTFPSQQATWCFDGTTSLWHSRAYRNPSTGILGRHKGNCYTYGFGKPLLGDHANGNVYELSMTTYTDNGDPLVSLRRFPHTADPVNRHRIRHSVLEVEMETGIGLDDSPPVGVNPQMILRFSNDGGHSWSNEHMASAGRLGKTRTRARWYRLGSPRDRVYEVSTNCPVKRVWLAAYLHGGVNVS